MSGRGQGDDAPGDSGARAVAGGRATGRSEPGTSGESGLMGAADTAVAMASATDSTDHGTTSASHLISAGPERRGEDLVGTTLLDRYSITRKIGQGGMGAVYEATHMLIGKRVAVKVLLDKYARKEQVVARLEQEARLASSIGHEHIIDITDFGTTADGRTFVVMEFLEGESLAELLNREGPLPEARLLHISTQISSALGAAHAKGIVHRDVKPENVFLLRRKDRDFIKVVDFGISKSMRVSDAGEADSPRLTQTGMVLGTPLYMSPEQARGDEELDHRIDIYALGVIMYELATGRVPFTGGNYLAIISQVLNDSPSSPRADRPELSEELEAIILKALAKDRDDRYQSTADMLSDLSALAEDPTHSTQRARITGPRRRRAVPRSGLRLAAWLAVIAVIIAGVVVTINVLVPSTPGTSRVALPIDAAGAPAVVDVGPSPGAPPTLPGPEVVEVVIVTIPPGAKIYEGARFLGQGPHTHRWLRNSEQIKLVASLDGYDDAECMVRPAIDKDAPVLCRLTRTKKGQVKKVIKKPPLVPGPNGSDIDPDSDPDGDGEIIENPLLRKRPR